MSKRRDVVARLLPVASALLILAGTFWASAAGNALRLDCGTAESPVMAGYVRLTADDLYSQEKGYGWEGERGTSVAFQNPGPPAQGHWIPRDKVFEENLTDLNRDAVASEKDMLFRADVPNGTYCVSILRGT